MTGRAPGPIPKREDVRRRRNKPEPGDEILHAHGAPVVAVPEPDDNWHPISRDWFVSLAESGQSRFYEPSDWQYARYIAEAMSRNLYGGFKMSAVMFGAVMSGMSELLTTEGSRRRARVELERDAPTEDASVLAIAEYRQELA
jgi:hypothetical protein